MQLQWDGRVLLWIRMVRTIEKIIRRVRNAIKKNGEKKMASLDEIYAQQYGRNVYAMAQQKGSILRPYVTLENMEGEKRHFDRVHPTKAVKVTSKYMPTPLIPTKFDRRTVHAEEFIWSDMMDWVDNLNVFIDPTSSIVKVGGLAMGHILDDIIVTRAFDGVAYEGKEGTKEVAFPDTQKIPVTLGGDGANSGLNIEKLIEARSKFGKADIDLNDPENELFLAVTQEQMDDLARSVDVRSRDYMAMRDLYEGKTRKFLGFTFVQTGRLSATAVASGGATRTCAAWCKSGVVLVVPKEISMSVDQRPDISNNWQALAKMKAGATRIEDEKVVQILCYEPNTVLAEAGE